MNDYWTGFLTGYITGLLPIAWLIWRLSSHAVQLRMAREQLASAHVRISKLIDLTEILDKTFKEIKGSSMLVEPDAEAPTGSPEWNAAMDKSLNERKEP